MSKYGPVSIQINRGIRDGKAGSLNNNNAVRNYAKAQYQQAGYSKQHLQNHMDRKDAGHIKAKNTGGQNKATNYMWEDRHDNRAHGDTRITKSTLKQGGRR
jgi:hypothetical protein